MRSVNRSNSRFSSLGLSRSSVFPRKRKNNARVKRQATILVVVGGVDDGTEIITTEALFLPQKERARTVFLTLYYTSISSGQGTLRICAWSPGKEKQNRTKRQKKPILAVSVRNRKYCGLLRRKKKTEPFTAKADAPTVCPSLRACCARCLLFGHESLLSVCLCECGPISTRTRECFFTLFGMPLSLFDRLAASCRKVVSKLKMHSVAHYDATLDAIMCVSMCVTASPPYRTKRKMMTNHTRQGLKNRKKKLKNPFASSKSKLGDNF